MSTCVAAGSLGEALLMNYQETQVVVPDSDAGQEIQAGGGYRCSGVAVACTPAISDGH